MKGESPGNLHDLFMNAYAMFIQAGDYVYNVGRVFTQVSVFLYLRSEVHACATCMH